MHTKNLIVERDALLAAIPDLEAAIEELSVEGLVETEGLVEYVKDLGAKVKERLTAISDMLFKNSELVSGVSKKDLSEQGKKLLKLKKETDFKGKIMLTDVEDTPVPAILGLSVDLLALSEMLEEATKISQDNLIPALDEADTLVSKMMADKDYQTKLSPGKKLVGLEKANADIQRLTDSVIDGKSMNDTKPMKEVIPSVASVETIRTNLLKVSMSYNAKDLKTVEKLVNTIAEKVRILATDLSNNSDIQYSKNSISELAHYLDINAKFVTNTTTVFYLTTQATDVLEATVKILASAK